MFTVDIVQDERHLPRNCRFQHQDTQDFRDRKLASAIHQTMWQAYDNNLPPEMAAGRVQTFRQVVSIRTGRKLGRHFPNKLLTELALCVARAAPRTSIILLTHTERERERSQETLYNEVGLTDRQRQDRMNLIFVMRTFCGISEFCELMNQAVLSSYYNFVQSCIDGTPARPEDYVTVLLSPDAIEMYYHNNRLDLSNTITCTTSSSANVGKKV